MEEESMKAFLQPEIAQLIAAKEQFKAITEVYERETALGQ